MTIQRYTVHADECGFPYHDPDPLVGEWVRYVDHARRELEHAKETRDLSERLAAALDLLEGFR